VNPQNELNSLISLFPDEQPLFTATEHIPSVLTPEPYKTVLVHDQHMTVTMEAHYASTVDVRILDRKHERDAYSRKILLLKTGANKVVQFGIMRFNFRFVTNEVRDEILQGEIPLGRILIDHNVLRHIDIGALLKVTTGPPLAKYLQMEPGGITYGRLATIFCNKRPAVDLLEISAPLD